GPDHVRRDPAEHHAHHPGRVHGPARLRGVRGSHAVLPRIRGAAADAGLGLGHRGQLQRPAGRLLVAGAVPGAGYRVAGNRGQLDHGLDRAGAERMSKLSAEMAGGTPETGSDSPALVVSHMDVTYKVRDQDRLALRDVSFSIARGESYGLVGESGSGKSTAALALVRYLPRNGRVSGGTILINGQDPLAMGNAELRQLRARTVSMVYQEPGRALNPSIRVGRQIAEVFELAGQSSGEATESAQDMLGRVQISDPARVMRRYPFELSGGMAQ